MAIFNVNMDNFDSEVLNAATPVVIDFWAPWCGYCRGIAPTVDQIADAYEGKIRVGKLNIDDSMPLAERYQISTITTLLFFRDGAVGQPLVNPPSRGAIEEWLGANGVTLD